MSKTFTYTHTLLVPYAAQQVYAVVDDVANYHQFLPNCAGSGVSSRSAVDDSIGDAASGSQRVLGYMDLAFLGMRYRLDSDNVHTPHSRIELRLLKGPFKNLAGQWDIKPLGDLGCKVSYAMQWEYANPLLAITVGQRFEAIAKQLLDAFIAETARRSA
jgi:ribosome-associated toxin RatA of RatAB toxin-antitoxin module